MAKKDSVLNQLHTLLGQAYGEVEKATEAKSDEAYYGHINVFLKLRQEMRSTINAAVIDESWVTDVPEVTRTYCLLAVAIVNHMYEVIVKDFTFVTRKVQKPMLMYWEAGCERVTEGVMG